MLRTLQISYPSALQLYEYLSTYPEVIVKIVSNGKQYRESCGCRFFTKIAFRAEFMDRSLHFTDDYGVQSHFKRYERSAVAIGRQEVIFVRYKKRMRKKYPTTRLDFWNRG